MKNIFSMKTNNFLFIPLIASVLLISSCQSEKQEEKEKTLIVPVKTQQILPETFKHFVNLTAKVVPINYAFISPEAPGQIKKITVEEGQKVQKGDLLISLNSSVVEGKLKSTLSQLDLAKITYEKQKDLWENKKIGSEIQYLKLKTQYETLQEQVKSLKAQIEMSQIRAPFAGVVDKIILKEGELASPGMKLIELVNLKQLKIIGDLSEKYLPNVHKGDAVDITFDTYPNFKYSAKIYRTGNIINSANRTFAIEVRVTNKNNLLKPNMISNIIINDYSKDSAFIVPSIIIKKDFDKQFLFVITQKDSQKIAQKRYIETSRSYKDKTLVTKGLKLNDQVIVEGYNTVTNGTLVKIIQ